jgi:hypothetical protein
MILLLRLRKGVASAGSIWFWMLLGGSELREKKIWMESRFWGGAVWAVLIERGRPVNGVYDGCRLGEWGLGKGLQPIERDEEVVTGCSKSAKTGEERLVSGCLWRIAGEWGRRRW